MNNVLLIGTDHNDVDGAVSLETALGKYTPAIVVVEGTIEKDEGSDKFRDVLYGTLRKQGYTHAHAKKWCDAVVQGYETQAAKKYCGEYGASFEYMNDSGKMISEEERAQKLAGTLERIKKMKVDKYIDNRRAGHRRDVALINGYLNTPLETLFIEADSEDYYKTIGTIREEQMKDKVLYLVAHNPDAKIAAIVGNRHIFKDPRNRSFYSLLPEPKPSRVLI